MFFWTKPALGIIQKRYLEIEQPKKMHEEFTSLYHIVVGVQQD
jgi:hypothetical protein